MAVKFFDGHTGRLPQQIKEKLLKVITPSNSVNWEALYIIMRDYRIAEFEAPLWNTHGVRIKFDYVCSKI